MNKYGRLNLCQMKINRIFINTMMYPSFSVIFSSFFVVVLSNELRVGNLSYTSPLVNNRTTLSNSIAVNGLMQCISAGTAMIPNYSMNNEDNSEEAAEDILSFVLQDEHAILKSDRAFETDLIRRSSNAYNYVKNLSQLSRMLSNCFEAQTGIEDSISVRKLQSLVKGLGENPLRGTEFTQVPTNSEDEKLVGDSDFRSENVQNGFEAVAETGGKSNTGTSARNVNPPVTFAFANQNSAELNLQGPTFTSREKRDAASNSRFSNSATSSDASMFSSLTRSDSSQTATELSMMATKATDQTEVKHEKDYSGSNVSPPSTEVPLLMSPNSGYTNGAAGAEEKFEQDTSESVALSAFTSALNEAISKSSVFTDVFEEIKLQPVISEEFYDTFYYAANLIEMSNPAEIAQDLSNELRSSFQNISAMNYSSAVANTIGKLLVSRRIITTESALAVARSYVSEFEKVLQFVDDVKSLKSFVRILSDVNVRYLISLGVLTAESARTVSQLFAEQLIAMGTKNDLSNLPVKPNALQKDAKQMSSNENAPVKTSLSRSFINATPQKKYQTKERYTQFEERAGIIKTTLNPAAAPSNIFIINLFKSVLETALTSSFVINDAFERIRLQSVRASELYDVIYNAAKLLNLSNSSAVAHNLSNNLSSQFAALNTLNFAAAVSNTIGKLVISVQFLSAEETIIAAETYTRDLEKAIVCAGDVKSVIEFIKTISDAGVQYLTSVGILSAGNADIVSELFAKQFILDGIASQLPDRSVTIGETVDVQSAIEKKREISKSITIDMLANAFVKSTRNSANLAKLLSNVLLSPKLDHHEAAPETALELTVNDASEMAKDLSDAIYSNLKNSEPQFYFKVIFNTVKVVLKSQGILSSNNSAYLSRQFFKILEEISSLGNRYSLNLYTRVITKLIINFLSNLGILTPNAVYDFKKYFIQEFRKGIDYPSEENTGGLKNYVCHEEH